MTENRIAVATHAMVDIPGIIEQYSPKADFVVGSVETPDDLAALTAGADALIVSLHRLTDAHIAALPPSVRIIARAGVGLDTIDVAAARAAGIRVIYQPNYATNEVADHAAALALAAWRRLPATDRLMRAQGWTNVLEIGPIAPLHDSTLGVLGTGRIGRAVIERLRPFVNRVVAFDVVRDESIAGVEWADDVADVLEQADLLTLHMPLIDSTRNIIDAAALARLSDDAVVVNVSRGGLIDETALVEALTAGTLRAAAIDVFETEPLPADSPLHTAPNLLLTPHVAWYSTESGVRMSQWSVLDVLEFLSSGEIEHGSHAWS